MSTLYKKPLKALMLSSRPPEPLTRMALDQNTILELTTLSDLKTNLSFYFEKNFQKILLDLDFMDPLQSSSHPSLLEAWRNVFQNLISKNLRNDGHPPELLAFTEHATWEKAQLGVHLGARNLCKFEELFLNPLHISSAENVLSPDFSSRSKPLAASTKQELQSIPFPIEGLDGQSSGIRHLSELIRKVAPTDTSILLVGETGCGKDLIAKSIHQYSSRSKEPFVTLSAGQLQNELVESELFGHQKGSFTGATESRKGILELADGGTLFIDDIDLLSKDIQAKLLRVLENKTYTPLGSEETLYSNFRLISASQCDLKRRIQQDLFRSDLYYRIQVVEINIPALRERKEDIPSIAQSIIQKLSRKHRQAPITLQNEILEKLLNYSWPGNVREMENILERSLIMAWSDKRNLLLNSDLAWPLQNAEIPGGSRLSALKTVVHEFEKEYIQKTIERAGGNKEHAAEVLGLSLASLYRKIA